MGIGEFATEFTEDSEGGLRGPRNIEKTFALYFAAKSVLLSLGRFRLLLPSFQLKVRYKRFWRHEF